MSDFIAQIQAVLDTSKIEAQLNALKSNQKIKLDVELSGDGANLTKILNNQMSSMSTTASKAGQNIGKSFNQGIKSVKFDGFYKNYFKQIEKDTKKAEDLVTKYMDQANKKKDEKNYVPTQAEALKAVQAKHSAKLKVQKAEQAEILKQQKLIADYTKKFEQGNYKATQSTMQSQLKKYADYNNVSLESARKYASEFDKVQSVLSKHFDGSSTLSDDKLISYFSKAEDAAKKFSNEMRVVSSNAVKPLSILEATTASNKTLTWLNNNTKAAKEYGQALKELSDKQKSATSREELNNYNKQFRSIVSEAERQGMVGNSFVSEMKRGFGQIGQFVGVYGVLQNGVDVAKQMAQAVLDVDTAMTELRKVSNASDVQLNTYFDEATESAKKYGATISDVISSAADWSRLGYSLDDSKRLSDITTLYQRVGDNMTQETASKNLVSTLQGFKLTADEAEHIVDSFNEVGNNFAIGSDGIGEALQRSASSMYAAGNTMEQTIGLVTAANEVVQDPSRIGNGFKTISMRLRAAETEMEELGLDTDGMAESTAKLQKELLALSGVDIMKDKNTFKSTYDILDELSTKWQSLTDIQRASITELIAGKNACQNVQKCA